MQENLPTAVEAAAAAATARGEAVLVFDSEDRLSYTNVYARTKLHFIDLALRPRFEDMVRTVVEGGHIELPPCFSLEEYIDVSNQVRRERPQHTFARQYGDEGLYLVRHERLDGQSSIQFRMRVAAEDSAWLAVKELAIRYSIEPIPPTGTTLRPLQWHTSFSNILDLFVEPTVLLSSDGTIQAINTRFADFSDSSELAWMDRGRLMVQRGQPRRRLDKAIRFLASCHVAPPSTLVRIGGTGTDTLVASVSRLPWPPDMIARRADTPAILVRFMGNRVSPRAIESVLAIAFGLGGEALEFAIHYCNSPDLEAVAAQLGMSHEEARIARRNILSITGFSSPIEFLQTALSISERVRRFNS